MKVVRLSALRTGRFYLWYRLSKTQGPTAAGRIISIKNSSDTIRNRTHDLPACSTVSEPTASPRAPTPDVGGQFLNLSAERSLEIQIFYENRGFVDR
jgi:hypothetical protein